MYAGTNAQIGDNFQKMEQFMMCNVIEFKTEHKIDKKPTQWDLSCSLSS